MVGAGARTGFVSYPDGKRQPQTVPKPRPPRTRPQGGIADPVGFEPTILGLESRCLIRTRPRVHPPNPRAVLRLCRLRQGRCRGGEPSGAPNERNEREEGE